MIVTYNLLKSRIVRIAYLSVTILTVHEALVASGTAASRDLLPSFSCSYLLNFLKCNTTSKTLGLAFI